VYSAYLRIFPKDGADRALDGWYLISFAALLIGYAISIVFTAIVWYICWAFGVVIVVDETFTRRNSDLPMYSVPELI
jgi:hypothetical protein